MAPPADGLEERQRRQNLRDVCEKGDCLTEGEKEREGQNQRGMTSEDGGHVRGEATGRQRHPKGNKDSAGKTVVGRERPRGWGRH